MSLNTNRLQVVKAMDPRVTSPGANVPFVYVEGAGNVTQKQYTTSSISNSSLQFSAANPPNKKIYVDRKIKIRVPIRLSMSCVSTAAGQYCITPQHDALHCYPFSSAVEVMQANLNNYSVSVNTADVLHPLVDRYNVDNRLKNGDWSCAPSYPDQSALYSSLINGQRNPLGGYDMSTDENVQGRGGFSQFYVQSNTGPSTAAGQTLTAVVDFVTTEPLFLLSPIYSGRKETTGFINLATFDMNITMMGSGANKMWSRSELDPALTISYQFAPLITTGPVFYFPSTTIVLLFQYFQPKESMLLPSDGLSLYNYFTIQRYVTDITAVPQYPQYATYNTNSIQLSGIPSKCYVLAKVQNYLTQAAPTWTDTYAGINNLSIQYNARSGLMASASQEQLYLISKKNGCNLSYTQWLGAPVTSAFSFNPANSYCTVGSVVALDFACDLGLGSLEADSKNVSATLQINVSLTSLQPGVSAYSIYIIIVESGIFTIHNGVSNAQVNVLTSEDILNAKRQPGINYESIKSMGSGDFLSGLKSFWNEHLSPFLKQTKLASSLSSLIPVVGKPLSSALSSYGYGVNVGGEYEGLYDDELGYSGPMMSNSHGSAMVGGQMMRDGRHIMM